MKQLLALFLIFVLSMGAIDSYGSVDKSGQIEITQSYEIPDSAYEVVSMEPTPLNIVVFGRQPSVEVISIVISPNVGYLTPLTEHLSNTKGTHSIMIFSLSGKYRQSITAFGIKRYLTKDRHNFRRQT